MQHCGLSPVSCVSQDASKLLEAWQKLLLDPSTTIPAAGCLRGQLLSLVSALVDNVVAANKTAAASNGIAALTAVLRLLELNPNIAR